MLWIIAILLVVFWLMGLLLKVTTGIIHLLLIVALALIVINMFRRRRPTV